jgi:hypothetical protein
MSDQPASPEKKSFQERFRSKNAAPPPPDKVAGHIAKSTNWYVKIHDSQLERLLGLKSELSAPLFLILLRKSFQHHGRPFELPTQALLSGLRVKQRHLQRTLHQLEQCGLILVARRTPKPPWIRVPLAP